MYHSIVMEIEAQKWYLVCTDVRTCVVKRSLRENLTASASASHFGYATESSGARKRSE